MPDIDLLLEKISQESGAVYWTQELCPREVVSSLKSNVIIDNQEISPVLIENLSTILLSRWQETTYTEELKRQVLSLKSRVAELERSASILVPIETFAPEPYKVIQSFCVVVQPYEDEYIASFFDANLSTSGETQEEAVFNLKDVIIATFEALTKHNQAKLGPGPAHQVKVLQNFIRKTT